MGNGQKKTVRNKRKGGSFWDNLTKAASETIRKVCTTAKRIKKATVKFVKNTDWKKVGIAVVATVAAVAVTVATAGAAGPIIAGMVGASGLTGLGAAVATGVAVGAISGAAGGGVHAFTSGVLSGQKPGEIFKNTVNGMVNGAISGVLTGGLLGGVGSLTSFVTNPLARYAADTLGETAVDTIVDASQGGKITVASLATSLAINAASEGVSARGAKGAKADIPTNKPKAGDVPVTKPRKDVTPVQQLSNPGPNPKALRIEAPKNKPKSGDVPVTKSLKDTTPVQQLSNPGPKNKDFDNWLNKGEADNIVYHGIDYTTGDAVYTGITKQGLEKRLVQHNSSGKDFLRLEPQHGGLTRNQARSVEQYLIENGNANQLNKINSIGPNNKMYEDAMQWAGNYLNGGK